MEFGPLELAEAEGAILAHSLQSASGRLRKGTRLGPEDIAPLRAAGHSRVIAARLGPGDMDEDSAAAALAAALMGPGLRASAAATGRVNLFAEGPGILRIGAEAIGQVNTADPAITVATLPLWHRCEAGTMVATIKIIPYAVARSRLLSAASAGQSALSLAAPRIARAALVETVTETSPTSDKGAEAVAQRLARLGAALDTPVRVAHEALALAAALHASDAPLLLILTGSATSDARDVAPEALRLAGGEVHHFGMPVDPGNLLFLGRLRDRPVIGLPGCARSPALNGADWVLERIVCGVPVGPAEIAAMGIGGLLKDIPTRPLPRDRATGGA